MSELPFTFDFRTFMESQYPSFEGTFFTVNGKKYSISRQNNALWNSILKEYRTAVLIDFTLILDIPFCIAYQVTHNTPENQQLFGFDIRVAFPIPKNVQDYFKFRTVLQLDQKASSHSSRLQDLSSQIAQLKALLASSLDYRQELVADIDELRRDLSDLQSEFNKANKRVSVLRNLMGANSEANSLFGRELAVLQPDFSSVLQDCETNLRIYSGQVRALRELISGKENMLSEQCAAIATIETNLRKHVVEQNETESALHSMQIEIFQELSKFGQDDLPHQLLKYVEESRLLSNKQQAASVLAKHFKKIADRNFVGSRIKSAPTKCPICVACKPNYFMLNCGHGAFCDECIPRFMGKCPNCRAPITSVNPFNLFDRKLFM